MHKSLFIGLFMLLILSGCTQQAAQDTITVGAIIPLTGPPAIWGESLQEGIELARLELLEQGINITVIYEDSQGRSSTGVSALNELIANHNPEVIISSLSSVSVPLIPISEQAQVPLIMTQVAAEGVINEHPYAYRFFTPAKELLEPLLGHIEVSNPQSIAIVAVGDEMGRTMQTEIQRWATSNNITILSSELYTPGNTDFRTELLKSQEADILFFASVAPPDMINFVRQYREVEGQPQLVAPSTTLSSPGVRNALGTDAEGIITVAHGFDLEITGLELREKYYEYYNKSPLYTVAYGYDMMQLIAATSTNIKQELDGLQEFSGANGNIQITRRGEINPTSYPAIITENRLVVLE